jgi:phosphate starvation-inducible protein PhoH
MAKPRKKPVKNEKANTTPALHASSKKPFHIEFMNAAQKMAWGAFDQHDVLFLLGAPGTGKALTLNSKLYTRSGYILMRDVKVGDEIANPDGNFSKVTGVFPQGKKQVCRVYFSDDTYVDCCEEHLWTISHTKSKGWKNQVKTTAYIEKNYLRSDGHRSFSVMATKPLNFDRQKFLINPYLMGIFIAEGSLTNSNVGFSSCESEVVSRITSSLCEDYVCKSKTKFNTEAADHRIVKKKRSGCKNIYKEVLKDLGLWGKKSYEKFIPRDYQYCAVDQRIALLQGLMDGDGTVEKRTGSCSYSTTSYQLAQDFCQLVYSLGGSTRIKVKKGASKSDGTRHRISYRCYVNLPQEIEIFFLQRKKRLLKSRTKYFPKRYIDRVERLNYEEMQCITVDHKDSLFLTDNFTVTHNSHLGCAFAISEILSKRKEKIVITRPTIEAGGRGLGFLPGSADEKLHPYMLPLFDCMDRCLGRLSPQRDIINKSVELAPLQFMRGRSFHDSVCILDEAQNCNYAEIKLFLTRFGQNSKVIITGDPMQSDLPWKDRALMNVVDRLSSLKGVGIINFKANSIVRHPLIAGILERLEDKEENGTSSS